MQAFSAIYAFLAAHMPAVVAFLVLVLPSVIVGLSKYPQDAGLVSFLKILLNLLSVLSHHDSPGTFKLPMTTSDPPNNKGFARLGVLVGLSFILVAFAILLAAPARADVVAALPQVAESDPPAPPVPQFGGCVKSGKLCFGPSVAMTVVAINLKTKTIEGAFSPGIGYGFTLNPGKWSSLGADAYFTLDPAAQKASASFLLKFCNGYLKAGLSKGIIGDVAWRIPLAIGVPLP